MTPSQQLIIDSYSEKMAPAVSQACYDLVNGNFDAVSRWTVLNRDKQIEFVLKQAGLLTDKIINHLDWLVESARESL